MLRALKTWSLSPLKMREWARWLGIAAAASIGAVLLFRKYRHPTVDNREQPAERASTGESIQQQHVVPVEEVPAQIPAEELLAQVPAQELLAQVQAQELLAQVPAHELLAQAPLGSVPFLSGISYLMGPVGQVVIASERIHESSMGDEDGTCGSVSSTDDASLVASNRSRRSAQRRAESSSSSDDGHDARFPPADVAEVPRDPCTDDKDAVSSALVNALTNTYPSAMLGQDMSKSTEAYISRLLVTMANDLNGNMAFPGYRIDAFMIRLGCLLSDRNATIRKVALKLACNACRIDAPSISKCMVPVLRECAEASLRDYRYDELADIMHCMANAALHTSTHRKFRSQCSSIILRSMHLRDEEITRAARLAAWKVAVNMSVNIKTVHRLGPSWEVVLRCKYIGSRLERRRIVMLDNFYKACQHLPAAGDVQADSLIHNLLQQETMVSLYAWYTSTSAPREPEAITRLLVSIENARKHYETLKAIAPDSLVTSSSHSEENEECPALRYTGPAGSDEHRFAEWRQSGTDAHGPAAGVGSVQLYDDDGVPRVSEGDVESGTAAEVQFSNEAAHLISGTDSRPKSQVSPAELDLYEVSEPIIGGRDALYSSSSTAVGTKLRPPADIVADYNRISCSLGCEFPTFFPAELASTDKFDLSSDEYYVRETYTDEILIFTMKRKHDEMGPDQHAPRTPINMKDLGQLVLLRDILHEAMDRSRILRDEMFQQRKSTANDLIPTCQDFPGDIFELLTQRREEVDQIITDFEYIRKIEDEANKRTVHCAEDSFSFDPTRKVFGNSEEYTMSGEDLIGTEYLDENEEERRRSDDSGTRTYSRHSDVINSGKDGADVNAAAFPREDTAATVDTDADAVSHDTTISTAADDERTVQSHADITGTMVTSPSPAAEAPGDADDQESTATIETEQQQQHDDMVPISGLCPPKLAISLARNVVHDILESAVKVVSQGIHTREDNDFYMDRMNTRP